jgi:hypothetical protein
VLNRVLPDGELAGKSIQGAVRSFLEEGPGKATFAGC